LRHASLETRFIAMDAKGLERAHGERLMIDLVSLQRTLSQTQAAKVLNR